MGATAAAVLQDGIAEALARVIEHEPLIRADEDPEGVHQARVGLRRIRSDLRTFGDLVEPAWAEQVRSEAAWLAAELGAVRDRDVLLAGLAAAVDRLDLGDRPAAAGVLDRLRRERAQAQRAAVVAVSSPRNAALLARLADGVPVLEGADRPASAVLPRLAGDAFVRLRKAVRRLPAAPSDDDLHRVRIRAKRARSAAILARPVGGRSAARAAKATASLQDVLGTHHDRVVAGAWLRTALPSATRAQAFVVGLLVADQAALAAVSRAAWRDAWKRTEAAGRKAWDR